MLRGKGLTTFKAETLLTVVFQYKSRQMPKTSVLRGLNKAGRGVGQYGGCGSSRAIRRRGYDARARVCLGPNWIWLWIALVGVAYHVTLYSHTVATLGHELPPEGLPKSYFDVAGGVEGSEASFRP